MGFVRSRHTQFRSALTCPGHQWLGPFSVPGLGPNDLRRQSLADPAPLDEIERKLDRIMEELQTPTAIGYSVRRGNFPNKD